MTASDHPKLEPTRLNLTVASSSTTDDAFPDFSDPTLFTTTDSPMKLSTDAALDIARSPAESDASSLASPSPITSPVSGAGVDAPGNSSSSTSKIYLPLPTLGSNFSSSSFALSEVNVEGEDAWFESLPSDIANADISISADGSFVETTSGPAARELKRRYDQHTGLSEDMRSPYVVTAIINQHGKQVYRVGKRSQAQMQDPSPTPELEVPPTIASSFVSSSGSASQVQRKRRSRLSITSVFKSPSVRASEDSRQPPASTSMNVQSGFSANATSMNTTTRKLRKPRSIPDMTSAPGSYFGDEAVAGPNMPPPASGRTHSHSVTGADMRPIVTTTAPIDPPYNAGLAADTFSGVMGWQGVPASPLTSSGLTPSSRSLNTPSDSPSQSPLDVAGLEQPFGRNVSFDSPFRNSAVFLPLALREMQSFESAKTARALNQPNSAAGARLPKDEAAEESGNAASESTHKHDSLDSIASSNAVLSVESEGTTIPNTTPHTTESVGQPERALPSESSRLFTQYRTAVFDVIQNYRGLPTLDTLATSRQPTIKMSLSALDGAVPRDDPRFVIWGETLSDDGLDLASTQESSSARSRRQSNTFSVHSRKRSMKGKDAVQTSPREGSPVRTRKSLEGGGSSAEDEEESGHRVLMAATIERWIAQLTSQFDYDELLIFFLTYRTYINAFDLCNLLICRFHWALEEPITQQEVVVKQIVRVRTFVAMRYWLLTFFRFDFLPNRELCLWFANWLNTLWRDPILDKYDDARNIVKKIKKIAKDCRDANSRNRISAKAAEKKGKMMQSIDKILGDLSNGVNFAATLRKAAAAQHEEDSDVDLDFNSDESSPFSDVGGQGFAFGNQLGLGDAATGSKSRSNSVLRPSSAGDAGAEATSVSSPTRPTTSPSRLILQQPLHLTILQHARAIQPSTNLPMAGTLQSPNGHHSSLSRVVVNTIGRLGRWKRVLSSRQPLTPLSPTADTTAFDLELNAAGDLFAVRGGVEQYLKMIDNAPAVVSSPTTPHAPSPSLALPQETLISSLSEDTVNEAVVKADSPPPTLAVQDLESANKTPLASRAQLRPESQTSSGNDSLDIANDNDASSLAESSAGSHRSPVHKMLSRVRSSERDSVRSGSSGSLRSFETTTSFFGNPLPRQDRTFPDVVSIDDLDDLDYLSDNSAASEHKAPPGLRPTKRLPNRRDFEFVRRSMDSVSSMGIISRESMAMSEPNADSARNSDASPKLGNAVAQWQVNALIDDLSDDGNEVGGVDSALKRLEGQINPGQQKKKAEKIDGWVKTIQERMAAGDFRDDEPRRFSSEEENDAEDEAVNAPKQKSSADDEDETVTFPRSSVDSSRRSVGIVMDVESHGTTPTPRQTAMPMTQSSSQDKHGLAEAKPKIDEAVPEEILLSRIPSHTSGIEDPARSSPSTRFNQQPIMKSPSANLHRSFILNFRAEKIAQHFSVIDREIFLGIKFEELVSDEWMQGNEDYNVRDWMLYLRERRRKAELRGKGKLSVLSAARARFNVVTNFVVSEVALTNPHDRVFVVAKFIRIAFKAYTSNNFATLVAIISGLCNDNVRRAMKRSWSRVGRWETRVFEDLKIFCTSEDDFGYIRRAIAAIVSAKPLYGSQEDGAQSRDGLPDGGSNKPKQSSDHQKYSPPSYCIPFIGVYLSQLYRYSRMPDLIDPSAPHEAVEIDPETGNFKACAYPSVFADLRPLPPSMQIEPLINVQKQRQIASVVKSLVTGQHLANKVSVDVDKRLLGRCLKLTALEPDAIRKILGVYTEY